MQENIQSEFSCLFCNVLIGEMFIKCETCYQATQQTIKSSISSQIYICLECFSCGLENDQHKNNHSYRVINLKRMPTFDQWNVHDELMLNLKASTNQSVLFTTKTPNTTNNNPVNNLESQKDNSKSVSFESSSSSLINRFSLEACIKHLEAWFQLFRSDERQKIVDTSIRLYKSRLRSTMLFFKESNFNQTEACSSSNNLVSIRPALNSKLFRLSSGYRPARGDFETEFRENFEFKHIADIDYGFDLGDESDESEGIASDENNENEESEISDMLLEKQLKFSVLNSYRDLVNERYERKKMIREFGILADLIHRSNFGAKNNGSHYLPMLNSDEHLSKIKNSFTHLQKFNTDSVHHWHLPSKFMKLFDNFESYAKTIELFNHYGYLKKRLEDLKEYRSQGLRSLKHVQIYNTYKLKRLNRVATCHMASLFTSLSRLEQLDRSNVATRRHIAKQQCQEWFKRFVIAEKSLTVDRKSTNSNGQIESVTTVSEPSAPLCYPASHMKYKNNPLRIENYPDSDKLDEDEKEFCRVARVQPVVYLRVKGVLVLENKKAGFCSYARARKLAGIDVNKTRLIHNLMLKLNLINGNLPKEEPIDNG